MIDNLMLLHLFWLLVINCLTFELVQHTKVVQIFTKLNAQLRNSFFLLTDDIKSDEEKEKAAVAIGIRLFVSVIQIIALFGIVAAFLAFIYIWYPDFFNFIIRVGALIFSAVFLVLYWFIKRKLVVRKL